MTRRPCLAPSIVQVQRSVLAVFLLFAAAPPAELHAQIAGQSVNMVSGTQWPGGDPFLQRQNEPSIAVSSRNPRHLLAGANDYRTVDVPFSTPNAPETGDAWLGVFKSFDGGITWKSTLLPGYPQQNPRTGPLATFSTAADPVVRAGTNGLFYYAGIAFNRDTKDGVVFVARFVDLNNKENGDPTRDQDPIRYIDTKVVDRGTGTPFIDKPWIAVDKPRLLDGVCNLTVPQPLPGNPNATVQQTVPAGAVYTAWTEATGSGSSLTTNVYFSSSSDCGASWGTPVRINDVNRVNQGASIAIDPATGVVYVVWRRFASGSQTDAILVSRSLRGRIFSKPSVVVSLPAYAAAHPTAPSFFDQGTTADSFRTNAYPTIAIDRRPNTGADDDDEPDDPPHRGRVYVAWSQRGVAPTGDARVVLSASADGGQSWSAPAPVDNAALADDSGNHFSRGHQFMPQMTSTANQVTVIYYDARLDHTFGLFSPRSNPLAPDPSTGKLYLEARDLRGELLDANGATKVFTPFFVETGMTEWRHTLDLRVAQASAAAAPVFTSSRLSQYIFGTRGGPSELQLTQLQINPPNLKLFQEGSVPFLGDYVDVAGQTFLPPAAPGRRWRFNSKPDPSAVYVASWTSNQDVRPPLDGNWANYTPSASTGGNSIFNPGIQRPPCVPGQEGMRDQNIYAARILPGLAVSSVQNAKPLSTILQRALAVIVENLTPLSRTFRLTIAGQPVGGRASFVPARNPPSNPLPAATTTLDVTIPPNSAVARSVYALSTDPNARIEVDVAEVAGPPGGLLKANGLTSFVIFNTDPSAPTLVNPDNSTAPSVTTVEVYNPNVTNPNVTNPNVTNPNVTNPNVTNPNVTNPNVTNPNVTNPNVTNPNVTNPDLANPNVTNPNVTNPNVTNPNVTNPNVTNPNVTNPNVTNAPVSDATYTVTNNGNTTSAYSIRLAGSAPANTPIQVIISKPYTTPASLNCVLFEQQHNIPVASIVNPRFIDPNSPPDPGITDPSEGNATFVLAPGESILVTIRGPVDIPTLTNIVQNVAPVIVAHASNTNDPTNRPASSPPVITTSFLPDGAPGQAYSAPLMAVGGTPPYVFWTATGLPAGLTINPATGVISGTPTAPALATVIVAVTDSAGKIGSRILSLRVRTVQLAAASAPTSAVGGQPFAVSFHVQDGGGAPLPGVSVTVGLGASPCPAALLSGTLLAVSNGAGDALFPALSIDRGGAGYTIVGTASLPSAPSAATAPFPVEGFCDTGGLSSPRKWHTATRLDNGKVLVAGGFDGASALASAELYDPTTRNYTLTGSMGTARALHSATLLADGRVLVVGGGSGFETGTLNTAELYDPASGTFSPAGSLAGNTRQAHGAVRLNDGRVLIAAGFTNDEGIHGLATAELYDPASGTFTPTASNMTHDRIGDFTTNLLPDGRVLLAGGSRNLVGGSVADADLFDPATSSFGPVSMSAHRGKHAADLRADGKVLLTGGENDTGFLATTDLFDPAGASFAASPASMTIAREAHTASRLATGRTLLAGGQTLSGLTLSVLASAELYDAALGSAPTGSLRVARQVHTATQLLDGTILTVGGTGTSGSPLSSSELFFPSAVLNITTTAIPTGFQGHPYQAILLTASGTPPLVWTAMAPLPAGLVLSPVGVLAGTPSAAGPTSVWVKVTDPSGNSSLARFPLFVAASTASDGPVTISGVSINGGGSEAVVLEGSTVTVALSYTIVDTLCPACIDQIPIGFAGSVPTACVYDGIPGPAGVSGSGSVSLTAPAVPGRYYVGFDRSQAFTCSGALGFWWNGAPGPSRYIGAIDVIDPHATDGPVTISNGSINGDGISATVSAGATYTVGLDYFIVDGPCPGCIDQIQMGLTVGPAETCAYDGIPGPAGVSGSSTVNLTAPTASGRYAIGFDRSQQFFCPTGAWWNSRPDPSRTVGVIVVP